MKLLRFLGVSLSLLTSSLSSTQAIGAGRTTERDDTTETIQVGKLERIFIVHRPPQQSSKARYPAVLLLHGGSGDAEGMIPLSGFNKTADNHGFIAVYPDGEGFWNDGRPIKGRLGRDDVTFIDRLLDTLIEKYSVDPARIYVAGISNGGFFTQRLALELPNRFAAAASVDAGLTPLLKSLPPKRPVPFLFVFGTDDPIVPFNGGTVGSSFGGRGVVLPFSESVDFWTAHNHCLRGNETVRLPTRDPADKTSVDRISYKPGAGGQEVVIYRVNGGGHTWPSGKQYLPKMIIGRTTHQISNEDIWSFFARHHN